MSNVRVFASLAGARTVARLFSAPNQVIYGIYDPTKPTLPLWSVDGNTAYGFRQFFNGYVFGPEGTSLSQLQDAVDAGQLPMIHANSAGVYPRLTIDDYLDAMYINVGTNQSIYSMYVKAAPVVVTPPVVVEPPVVTPPVVPPVTPPTIDPCAECNATVAILRKDVSNLGNDLDAVQSDLDKTQKAYDKLDADMDDIHEIIQGVTISPRGGGIPMNALRKIKKILAAQGV